MVDASWSIERWKDLFEIGGTFSAIVFTGIALHIDARVRRAQTLIEITKQHREIWMYFDDHPELAALFDKERDLEKRPLTAAETRFGNWLLLHLHAAYGAQRGGINVLPEHVGDDWREILSHPAMAAVWAKMKNLHERKFVALVEAFLK